MLTDTIAPWPSYSEEEIAAVADVLGSNRVNYWTGNQCREFEREFADYHGQNHAIAVANGTVALELALEAAGIGAGDDVIVTPRTFIASASCVVRLGGRPVFADVCANSQNISPDSIRAALTPETKAVVAVHHAGWPCDMPGIMALADEFSLVVIEDCAQAHGARINGKLVGSFGHINAWSFCQDKIMTTGGEGGMVVTNDKRLWEKAWSIKDHGKSYEAVFEREHASGFRWLHESFGTNYRMTEMQAAIGRYQLRKLSGWLEKRAANAREIQNAVADYPVLRAPVPGDDIQHACYRQYLFVDEDFLADNWSRDRIASHINEAGIPCLTGSCSEIYLEQAFVKRGLQPPERMPIARELGDRSLAFLVHPNLTQTDVEKTCGAIVRAAQQASSPPAGR